MTASPQEANPRPNLFRLPADRALVNRLGFPNEGAERLAARLRSARRAIDVPVGVSVGKSRIVPVDDLEAVISDYRSSLDRVRSSADFVVVNVSSPNTAGLRAMQAREHAHALLSALVAEAHRSSPAPPLLVKIAPDLDDRQLEDLLSVVEEVGLAGVVATNTTVARSGLASDPAEVESIGAGGLSGPPLRARALEVVRRVRSRLGRKVVVIGVGGVETPEHALAFMRAGADLVQLYTGFVYGGPLLPYRLTRGLARLVEREGAANVAELVGAGLDRPASTAGR